MAKSELLGLRDLRSNLLELPKATARAALQRTLKKAAEPTHKLWVAKAPDDPITGPPDLKTSIVVGPSSRLTGRQKRDAKKEGKFFAEIHVGTADPAGQQQEYGNVNHPAQPSGRPAWEATKERALETIKTELGTEIEKSAQRLARKAARLAAKG